MAVTRLVWTTTAAIWLIIAGPASAMAFQLEKDFKKVPAGTYKLDPGHANVLFRISHLGYSTYIGRFDKIEATLDFNPDGPKMTADVSIDVASVNTNHKVLEDKLRSDKFFDAAKYPRITFKSDGLKIKDAANGVLSGTLTMHGVSKPVSFDVVFNGGAVNPFAKTYGIGFSARGKIKRSDFGIKAYLPMVGDIVEFEIQAEFHKSK